MGSWWRHDDQGYRRIVPPTGGTFTGPELKEMVKYLEGELGGQEYFMGKEPGRADFMLSFPMDVAVALSWVDLGEYEGLKGWRERCQAREAWKRGLEKGNGYNMGFMMEG